MVWVYNLIQRKTIKVLKELYWFGLEGIETVENKKEVSGPLTSYAEEVGWEATQLQA